LSVGCLILVTDCLPSTDGSQSNAVFGKLCMDIVRKEAAWHISIYRPRNRPTICRRK